MSCNYELPNNESEEIKKLVEHEIDFTKSNLMLKTLVLIKNFDGISPEHVGDTLCENLYDLTLKYHLESN